MGNELFGIDIAGIVAEEIGPGLLDVVFTNYQLGNRTAGDLSAGRAKTPTSYSCKGFWESYPTRLIDGEIILQTDRRAVLIGDTMPAGVIPKEGTQITIEGKTLAVVRLESRDPAAAVYVFQCRDRRGPDGQ